MSPLCWTCGMVSRMLEMYRDAESMFAFSPVTIQQTCRSWQKKTHLNFLFCNRDCDLNQSENISLFWSTCVMFYHWEMQKYETFITFLRGKNNISHYNYFERCYLKCLPAPLYILASSLYPTELAPGMLDVDWIRYCWHIFFNINSMVWPS